MSQPAPINRKPTLAHRLEYALYRGAESLLGLINIETAVHVGRSLGKLAWRISAKHRMLVTRNLRIATADQPPALDELEALVKETFCRAGGNLFGGQKAATMKAEEVRAQISYEGMEHILDPITARRGVVVVWGHMGNWEALAQLAPELGVPVTGGPIYRPLENPLLDDLTVQRRTKNGALLFNRNEGFSKPISVLREGGIITVMSDQRAGGHGTLCPFFGRLSSCTPLASLMARRSGADLVSISISTTSSGRWHLRVRPLPSKSDTPSLMLHVEEAMRDSLTDVFWFHDRWRVDKERPLCFFTKESPSKSAGAATQPTRIAVTLPQNDPAAVEFLTATLEMRADVRIDVLDTGDLPELPNDPRIVAFPWDRSTPAEQIEGALLRCDTSHPVPLDAVVLLDNDLALARAAKAIGLRAVIGTGQPGKYWTRRINAPSDAAGWREFAFQITLLGKNRPK